MPLFQPQGAGVFAVVVSGIREPRPADAGLGLDSLFGWI